MKEVSAGGVVYRNEDGVVEVQLIRDRFGKMTLPKGKMEAGETVEQTALREIIEETGIVGRIVAPLDVITYEYTATDSTIVHKEVHYYLVEASGGLLQAQVEEIAGVQWYSPAEAQKLQEIEGYDNNDAVVSKALALLENV